VWESPSASLIEQDPEVIPDVDIAAQVGKDLFLDEKIPRHESGQGYVRVVEKSMMWRETETAKVFTYQGLTTCTELDKSWTIMSVKRRGDVGGPVNRRLKVKWRELNRLNCATTIRVGSYLGVGSRICDHVPLRNCLSRK
jgi:hypothetical protein